MPKVHKYKDKRKKTGNPKIICANGIKKHHLRRKSFNKLRNYDIFTPLAQIIDKTP